MHTLTKAFFSFILDNFSITREQFRYPRGLYMVNGKKGGYTVPRRRGWTVDLKTGTRVPPYKNPRQDPTCCGMKIATGCRSEGDVARQILFAQHENTKGLIYYGHNWIILNRLKKFGFKQVGEMGDRNYLKVMFLRLR